MLNVIALTILAGMMFIPFINVVVGIVAGAALSGVWGCLAGAALAVLITTGELVAVFRRAPNAAPLFPSREWFRVLSPM
jgi:hypothetical protein